MGPKKTENIAQNDWGLSNHYIWRTEKKISENRKSLGYIDEKLEYIEAYITPKLKYMRRMT